MGVERARACCFGGDREEPSFRRFHLTEWSDAAGVRGLTSGAA